MSDQFENNQENQQNPLSDNTQDANYTETTAENPTAEQQNPENQGTSQQQYAQPIFDGNSYPYYSYPGSKAPSLRSTAPTYERAIALAAEGKSFSFVIMMWIFGLLASETFFRSGFGFGLSIPLLNIILFSIAAWFYTGKENPFRLENAPLLISIGLISAGFFFTYSSFTYTMNVFMLIFLTFVTLGKLAGFKSKAFSGIMIKQTLLSVFAYSFYYLDMPFKTIKNVSNREKNGLAKPLKIILGVIISLPVAIIFILLFTQADEMFKQFVDRAIELIGIDLGWIIFDFIFGTFIFMFTAASLFATKAFVPKESDAAPREHKGVFDPVICSTVLAVISLIHILFIAVQFRYLYSGESYFRNEGFRHSYSSYVTQGFTELCISSIMLFALMLFIFALVRRTENGSIPLSIRIFIALTVVCNLNILASVIFRLLMYIENYDLTVKRLALLWFILIFGICGVEILIKFFIPGLKIFNCFCVTAVIMVILLNAFNINAFVANYNADHYFQDTAGRHFDFWYIESLGTSAAPSLIKLYQNEKATEEVKNNAKSALERISYDIATKKTWRNIDLPAITARKAIKKAGIRQFDSEGYDSEGFDLNRGMKRTKDENGKYSYQSIYFDEQGQYHPYDDYDKYNAYSSYSSYDESGYDYEGFDQKGYDREGFDRGGYNYDGFDRYDYDRDGYDKSGFNREGFNRWGYDKSGNYNNNWDTGNHSNVSSGYYESHLSSAKSYR